MVQGVLIEDGCLVDTNPATGEVIGRVKCTTHAQVSATIAAARAAQPAWAATALSERISLLKGACNLLASKQSELAELITREMGKVSSEAREEAAGIAKDDYLDLIAAANAPTQIENGVVVREPHGVVAVCSPWNFPADEALLLTLPALAAGNTVVLKPSEVTPLTGAFVGDVLAAALPPNVFALVQGDGAVGAALVGGDVDFVGMTGSSAVGKKIMASCAEGLKRLVLELGGKDPMIVFRDADLKKAAADAVEFSLMNCGQVCCSVERIYVDKAILPEFEAEVGALAKEWKAGNGTDPDVKIGPLVSAMQKERVASQVAAALDSGARVVCRASAPTSGGGHFYPATVLSDVDHTSPLNSAETFGPVVAICAFDGTEAEAVRLANDSEFGLAAYVYTRDLQRASRVAMGIKAGQVGINSWSLAVAPAACPWIGMKSSGFGYHSGADGWRQFSVPKSLIFATEEEVVLPSV